MSDTRIAALGVEVARVPSPTTSRIATLGVEVSRTPSPTVSRISTLGLEIAKAAGGTTSRISTLGLEIARPPSGTGSRIALFGLELVTPYLPPPSFGITGITLDSITGRVDDNVDYLAVRYQIATTSRFELDESILADATDSTGTRYAHTFGSLLNGNYYLRAKVLYAEGWSVWSHIAFITLGSIPEEMGVFTYPASGGVLSGTETLQWNVETPDINGTSWVLSSLSYTRDGINYIDLATSGLTSPVGSFIVDTTTLGGDGPIRFTLVGVNSVTGHTGRTSVFAYIDNAGIICSPDCAPGSDFFNTLVTNSWGLGGYLAWKDKPYTPSGGTIILPCFQDTSQGFFASATYMYFAGGCALGWYTNIEIDGNGLELEYVEAATGNVIARVGMNCPLHGPALGSALDLRGIGNVAISLGALALDNLSAPDGISDTIEMGGSYPASNPVFRHLRPHTLGWSMSRPDPGGSPNHYNWSFWAASPFGLVSKSGTFDLADSYTGLPCGFVRIRATREPAFCGWISITEASACYLEPTCGTLPEGETPELITPSVDVECDCVIITPETQSLIGATEITYRVASAFDINFSNPLFTIPWREVIPFIPGDPEADREFGIICEIPGGEYLADYQVRFPDSVFESGSVGFSIPGVLGPECEEPIPPEPPEPCIPVCKEICPDPPVIQIDISICITRPGAN